MAISVWPCYFSSFFRCKILILLSLSAIERTARIEANCDIETICGDEK
jgi:hypothetical protein